MMKPLLLYVAAILVYCAVLDNAPEAVVGFIAAAVAVIVSGGPR